jgi:hypothetical protein
MNSAVQRANSYGGAGGAPYTLVIMTQQRATSGRLVRCHGGGNSLGESRVAMSEVQIGGIPKQSAEEVAPTP